MHWFLQVSRRGKLEETNAKNISNHVVIAGFGRMGQSIAQMLSMENVPYIGIDTSSNVVHVCQKGFHVFFGDASHKDILAHAGIERACAVVVTIDKPAQAIRCVATIKKYWPEVKVFARAWDDKATESLRANGADAVVQETQESSLSLAQRVFNSLGVPEEALEALRKKMLKSES